MGRACTHLKCAQVQPGHAPGPSGLPLLLLNAVMHPGLESQPSYFLTFTVYLPGSWHAPDRTILQRKSSWHFWTFETAWLLDKFPSWRMTLAHFQVSFFLADTWGLRSRKEGLCTAGRLKAGFPPMWHRGRGNAKPLLLLWPAGLLLVGTLSPDIQDSRNCKFSQKAGRPFGTWTYPFTHYCPPVFPANPEPEPLSAAKTLLSTLNDVKDFL